MWRKLSFILLLAIVFGALLFFRPWKESNAIPTRIIDRLPVATMIGQSNILNLSKDLSKTLFYYQIPFRDVLSPTVILSRSKKYGIDSQKPVYFFVNDSLSGHDFGVIVSVSDESKIDFAIQRIAKSIEIRDTSINQMKLHYSPEYHFYLAYEKDWMLIYRGKNCQEILQYVTSAKVKSIHPRWRDFFNHLENNNDDLIAEIQSSKLKEFDVKSTFVRLENDSTDLILHTIVQHYDSLAFQIKPGGKGFPMRDFTRQLVNLNLDIKFLKSHPNHPYRRYLKQYSTKIGFPIDEFWKDFDGNIAFRQGGIQYIKERYMVSELDEDFNVTEVFKTRQVQISNFALFLTTNLPGKILFNKVEEKGVISEDGKKHRFVFSPPFNRTLTDSSIILYTSKYEPVVNDLINNQVLWTINYTPVHFYLDSTTTKTVYGRIQFPLKKIISDNIL